MNRKQPSEANPQPKRGAWKRGGGTSGLLREPAEAFGKAMKTQRREERREGMVRSLRANRIITERRALDAAIIIAPAKPSSSRDRRFSLRSSRLCVFSAATLFKKAPCRNRCS